ncbi:hypothetical protein [Caenimonas aquaedulcis]|uniref:Uncharacterized protein n=1 Tax=Caenimonas aquaedulcis TaxID=2793270 RepID=A0A931MHG3_9BURK|nr:hypothetical protein [Caenimonas aquaedulcis]MBG9388714.1 hypothetical protein [Caenimonas aquaedulcis]
MDEWRGLLDHPAVQAAAIPFLVSLAVAAPMRRARFLALGIVVAFVAAVGLTVGYSFEPLTATRKLILAGAATAIAIAGLSRTHGNGGLAVRCAISAAAAAAALWMLWRVLQQEEVPGAYWKGLAAAAYVAALVGSSLSVEGDPARTAAMSMVQGLSAGGLALLGASALLAQFGIAIGAGAGAVLLAVLLRRQQGAVGAGFSLPSSAIAAMVGLLIVFTGSLPWVALLPTLLIPWAALMIRAERFAPWPRAVLTVLACAVPMIAALALAWYVGAPPA